MRVHVGNTKIFLEFNTESEQLMDLYEKSLMRYTGVRVDGFQFTREYKIGVWDGYTHLYDKKEHMLPTGLWSKLDEHSKEFQRSHGDFTYEYLDERSEEFIDEEDFPEEIKVVKGDQELTLRDYQYGSVKESILNRNGIVKLSTNAGKCIVSQTYILTANGYTRIGDVLVDWGVDSNDINPREIPANVEMINRYGEKETTDALTVNGERHVIRIKNNLGITQEVTDNHPLLVMNKSGEVNWVESKDIKVGDYLVSRIGDNIFGNNNSVNEEEAYFIGLLIADGYIAGENGVEFTNDQPELLDFMEATLNEKYGNLGRVRRVERAGSKGISINLSSRESRRRLKDEYGLDYVKSIGKTVPAYIMSSPKNVQLSFLTAYLETEGSWNTTDKLGMEVTSKSKELMHLVQLMLLNLGVATRLTEKRVKKYPDNVYYRLTFSSVSTAKLLPMLNFKTNQRISQRVEYLATFNARAYHNSRESVIPYAKTLLKKYAETIEYGTYGNDKTQLYRNGNGASAQVVREAIEKNPDGDKDLRDYISELANGNYLFNKVLSVEDGGMQPTFDLSMPKTHSFIAEGNINHNTLTSVGIINTLLPYMEDDERIAYIVPSKNIFEQAIETMVEQYGKSDVGYIGDGKSKISKINVIMMQSLYAKLKRPDGDIKLTGKKRESQIFAQEIYPKFERVTNLVSNLRNFITNYDTKGVSYRENLKKYMIDLAYDSHVSDAKIRMAFNKELVKYNKLVEKQIGDKLDKWQMYQDLVKDTRVLILDEAHHAKADTYYDTLLQFDNAVYKMGMTGSIDSKDKLMVARLNAIFDRIVYEVRNSEMITRGVSAKPIINMVNIREPMGLMSKKNFQEVYAKGIVSNETRNRVIVNFANALVKSGKQTLIIVNYTEHGEYLEQQLKDLGVSVEFTHGQVESTRRTEQLNSARAGDVDVLIATSVLDEGVDISGFRALIMAGGFKSLRLVLQRIGRVLRRKEDDNTALVYDFVERTNEILYKHSMERVRIYEDEGFEIKYLN